MTASVIAQEIASGLGLGGVYGILGLAFAITFGVQRVLNLAYGEILMVGAVTGAAVAQRASSPTESAAALIVGLGVSVAVGLGVQAVAIAPLGEVTDPRSPRHTTALVATIGAATVIQNLARVYFGPYPRPFPPLLPSHSVVISGTEIPSAPLVIAVASLSVMTVVWWLLYRTDFGLGLRSAASDPHLAAVNGVNAKAIEWRGVALGASLAGAAGICVGTLVGAASPTMSATIGFKGLVVATVAGLGRVRATIIVAFALGLTEAAAVALLNASYRDAVASAALVVFLVANPRDPDPGRVG